MTRPQLVLHIGDPKTGSSSIQRVLFDKAWECAARTLDYPGILNAYQLVNSLKRGAEPGMADQRFAHYVTWLAASQADVAVISAETFGLMDPVAVQQAMQRYFPDHAPTMQVVAYARPHVSRFLSAYVQRTKVGQYRESLADFFTQMNGERLLNFHPRFAKWRAVFGPRFTLRAMEREVLRDGDVVADFLGVALQNQPFRILGATQTNSSMPVEGLAGLRFLLHLLQKAEFGDNLLHLIGAHINNLVTMAPIKGTKLRVTQAMYDDLLALCSQDAALMDRDFFETPVMTQALHRAARDVAPSLQDWTAKSLYTPDAMLTLRRISRRIAKQFAAHPRVWEAANRRERGYGSDDVTPRQAEIVAQTDAILAEAAAVLATACGAPQVGV